MNFRRKSSSEEISGFLDQGTAVTGELQFSGTLRIDGNFHGSIMTNDVLVVGEHAVIHADIKAGEVEVHGRVFGNIEGKRRIEIHPTGCVRGDIQTPALMVNSGATFDGRSRMPEESSDSSAAVRAEDRPLIAKGVDETD
jgi:cytoskeletal protein CcmA (bactofilin family)